MREIAFELSNAHCRGNVNAQAGGKLAQLGSRLIDSTAKKLSVQFFTKFGKIVEKQAEPPAISQEPSDESAKQGMWNKLKKSVGAG